MCSRWTYFHLISACTLALLLPAAHSQVSQLPAGEAPSDANALLLELRDELRESRRQIQELRERVRALEARTGAAQPSLDSLPTRATPLPETALAPSADGTLRSLQEGQELLAARVEEHAQTSVESASRYKVRISGLVLLNASANQGRVNIQDMPGLAFNRNAGSSGGDFGATLRQSVLGVEVFGPRIAGAASSAGVEMDFFGGFPRAAFGATNGLVRLRTAHGRLDWHNTTVTVGQEAPFFSPLSPTSYATLGEPAFSWSGNLWVWTPQIRVERRWSLSDNSRFSVQGGVLDPMTEGIMNSQFQRAPGPGESSRLPATAGRIGWSGVLFGRPAQAGASGYLARHNYGFDRTLGSWSWMADYNFPLSRHVTFSGEFFRGQALGGLGGGVWNSIVADQTITAPVARIAALNTIGGWSQLKFPPTQRWEWNLAAGTDNPFASDLQRFGQAVNAEDRQPLARNQSAFLNVIFRPRSNLLVALEYRRLRTYFRDGNKAQAGHVNLAIGVSF